MAIIDIDDGAKMYKNLMDLMNRFDEESFVSGVSDLDNISRDTETTDDLIIQLVAMDIIEKAKGFLDFMTRLFPGVTRISMLKLGMLLGMRYAFDFGTPECARAIFKEMPMFDSDTDKSHDNEEVGKEE